MRRGQAAIEYLIILAVVVIIALIVIGVIGGFPGMTRGISERDSAAYWASADVGVTRYFVSNGTQPYGSLLVVRNNRLFAVNITNITLGGNIVYPLNPGLAPTTAGLPLAPGSSSNMTINTTTLSQTCTPGNSYSVTTVITYVDSVYSNIYKFTGEKPLVGTCQT
ncbi:hypothetical protein H0N99_01060 [Candidatus Micrarchaeota archaeon]|nr:hypothetical protein [Candidatus Micrarchaeota archaeon]